MCTRGARSFLPLVNGCPRVLACFSLMHVYMYALRSLALPERSDCGFYSYSPVESDRFDSYVACVLIQYFRACFEKFLC